MITERLMPLLLKSILMAVAYEMKGTWVLKNDFMSGPFINYTIIDKENNRA
jgi:hypothetical protein